jgi:hypothetical protein
LTARRPKTWLAFIRPPAPAASSDRNRRQQILVLALAVGTVGGIYGIGGGSILGPILVGFGFTVGLGGAYLGVRLQTRLPEELLRRGLGGAALRDAARRRVLKGFDVVFPRSRLGST